MSTRSFRTCSATATFGTLRVGARVVSRALVVATGLSIDGTREVLGTAVGDSESSEFWRELFSSLKARGLTGVPLVISDAYVGMKSAVAQPLTGSSWKRCRLADNLMARTPKSSWQWVRTLLHSVFDQPDAHSVVAQYDRVVDALSDELPNIAEHLDAARADLLAFTAFPTQIWRQIWSNNPQERLNREALVTLRWVDNPGFGAQRHVLLTFSTA
ncbi:transposase [Mycobacterium sp. SM1]|nr:transposase [Mycobacterium sp. SM1]